MAQETDLAAPFIQRIIWGTLSRIREDMTRNMKSYNRTTTGKSVASLIIEEKPNGAKLEGSGSWLAMERGRKGGRVPRNFSALIRQWIIDKGLTVKPLPYKRPNRGKGLTAQERGLRSMASAIAYTIMKKGTLLHRKKGFQNIYSTPIQQYLKRMDEQLLVYASDVVNTIHRTILNKK